jgi:ribonuclease R
VKKHSSPPSKHKPKGKRHAGHATGSHGIPEVTALVITEVTEGGELIGQPLQWDTRRQPPLIIVTESGRSKPVGVGDRVLAKLRKVRPQLYQALVIRALPGATPQAVIGVFVPTTGAQGGGIIEPVSRRHKESYMVAHADMNGAQKGELVSAITLPGVPSMGMQYAKITERLGRLDSPKAASLIASHMHNLPSVFSEASIAESEAAEEPRMEKGREDLRAIPLVTIDGEDARDFDDAVFAGPDGDGWHIIVAIADVAYYVTEGSALDAGAFERGNSVYFPDRVIPMLPERLSNGLCSLRPDEDRYCLAVHLWIDAHGNTKRYKFVRGLMRSRARLTYTVVQHAIDTGEYAGEVGALIKNLQGGYRALATERDKRGALNLNLPEYKIVFDDVGNVANIVQRAQMESHRLIESYMIAANVAAADYLIKHRAPGIYRVHEPPSEEKLNDLYQLLKMAGYSLSKGGGVTASHFNRVLKKAEGQPEQQLIHTSVLRSQMQAYYAHENLGHFGLSLQKYCHFTSPIRRYSDLIVHRSLVELIAGQKPERNPKLPEIALHISDTERKAMLAERDASDRYKVAFMSRQIGNTFYGTITGLNEYGLFVTLRDNGVTGFIPVRALPGDFYQYDKKHARFFGARTRRQFILGEEIIIRVEEANAMTGSLLFRPEEGIDTAAPLRPKKTGDVRHKPKHKGGFKGKRRK